MKKTKEIDEIESQKHKFEISEDIASETMETVDETIDSVSSAEEKDASASSAEEKDASVSSAEEKDASASSAEEKDASVSSAEEKDASAASVELAGASASKAYVTGASVSPADVPEIRDSKAEVTGASVSPADVPETSDSSAELAGTNVSSPDMTGEGAAVPNILGTESIPKLLLKFSVPGVISMVVNSLYNIVDQIFIGRGVGYLGNGATTVIFPMTALAMAFIFLIGDGTASLMSLKLGEKKDEDAAKGAAAGMIGTIIVGVILFIIYNLFLEQFCRLFGASDAILPYAIDYGRIISIGMIFFAVCGGMSSFIRADGSPRFTMAGLLTGCIINVILDPIMIFVFDLGVKGAAFATIFGQFVNCCMNIWYCFHMKSVKIDKRILKDSISSIPKVMKLGISSCLNQLALVVAMAARNNILVHYGALSKYGEDIPLTTLGITMKVFSIIISIIIGTSAGAQPIMGYNYGSKQYDRVKKTFKIVVTITTSIMILALLIAQLFPRQVIGIFGNDESEIYYEFAVKTMRIYLMLLPFGGLQIVSGIFFQALGYPAQASILSLSKQIIFQLPATLVLPIFMGVEGALWAGPFSDITSFVLTIIMLCYYWKRIFNTKNPRLAS